MNLYIVKTTKTNEFRGATHVIPYDPATRPVVMFPPYGTQIQFIVQAKDTVDALVQAKAYYSKCMGG